MVTMMDAIKVVQKFQDTLVDMPEDFSKGYRDFLTGALNLNVDSTSNFVDVQAIVEDMLHDLIGPDLQEESDYANGVFGALESCSFAYDLMTVWGF